MNTRICEQWLWKLVFTNQWHYSGTIEFISDSVSKITHMPSIGIASGSIPQHMCSPHSGTLKGHEKENHLSFISKFPSCSNKNATLSARRRLYKPEKMQKWKTGGYATLKFLHQLAMTWWILKASAKAYYISKDGSHFILTEPEPNIELSKFQERLMSHNGSSKKK